ncbi:hypothetical protein C8Q73DRAFT_221639 [Cubamyces lactineus]|nr:hypothetical protein C8Q73DRAFT_221639 [Cubamyces lactineus]
MFLRRRTSPYPQSALIGELLTASETRWTRTPSLRPNDTSSTVSETPILNQLLLHVLHLPVSGPCAHIPRGPPRPLRLCKTCGLAKDLRGLSIAGEGVGSGRGRELASREEICAWGIGGDDNCSSSPRRAPSYLWMYAGSCGSILSPWPNVYTGWRVNCSG